MEDRRSFVRRVFAVGIVATAGCVDEPEETVTGGDTPTSSPAATDTASPEPTATASPTPTSTETGTPTGTPTETGTGTGTGTPSAGVVEVAVGPEGRLRFVPETVEISTGDTVRWTFESPGHNVTAKAGASERVEIPEGAEPFASYEGDQHYSINEVGTTYEHTFTVPGEYVYVCEPHADQGMIGTVVVSE